jgi:Galactose oxidase, central domain
MVLRQSSYFFRAFIIPTWFCITLLLLPIAAIAQSSPTWTQLSTAASPTARSYLAMTYDPISRKIIMFGGWDGRRHLNDTWTFDGSTWTHLHTRGPLARAAAQMAYDKITQKVVLFGGFNGRNYLGDTWIFDGATSRWTQAKPAHSPTPVTGPMLFTDPNGHVDVYGGFDGQFYQYSMWQWTGTGWNQLNLLALPFARSSAAVGVNQSTGRAVLFGGLADINPVNTWVYTGTTWTEKFPSTQPLWVYAGSAAFDANLNAVVLFGGGSGGIDQDTTWKWSSSNWTQLLTTQSPPAREGAGMVYDPLLGHVIVFGGQNNEVPLGDTWELLP